ncbi:MAG: hypothetical protein ACPGTO_02550 [Polaribacter sp.]
MSTKDLIIEKVNSINNPKLLVNILSLLSIEESLNEEHNFLTDDEEKRVRVSLENVKHNGKIQ